MYGEIYFALIWSKGISRHRKINFAVQGENHVRTIYFNR